MKEVWEPTTCRVDGYTNKTRYKDKYDPKIYVMRRNGRGKEEANTIAACGHVMKPAAEVQTKKRKKKEEKKKKTSPKGSRFLDLKSRRHERCVAKEQKSMCTFAVGGHHQRTTLLKTIYTGFKTRPNIPVKSP